jgi:chromosomal replication initiation ATPase DnaA
MNEFSNVDSSKAAAAQLAFDFPSCPSFADSDFLIARCNEEAVAWIGRWPDWPAPALTLVGPPGAGKTHLLRIFQERVGALVLAPDALAGLDPEAALGDARTVVLDDPEQALASRAAAEGLFHLYNRLALLGGHLAIAGRRPPSRWRVALPDLASRLSAAVVAEIKASDDALLAAVLVKLFADRQLRPSNDVLGYILPRAERSVSVLSEIVAELDRRALAERRAVTQPLAADVLRSLGREA